MEEDHAARTFTIWLETPEQKMRAYEAFQAGRADIDVPPVEDFPLCPEEESEEMSELSTTLGFRSVRAGRRWRGEMVTLRQVITEAAEQLEASSA